MSDMRITLANCGANDLLNYARARAPFAQRQELIFAAGALKNRELRAELGCTEQATWDEGRRAADPTYTSPYIPDR